jgi:hypothetical protein
MIRVLILAGCLSSLSTARKSSPTRVSAFYKVGRHRCSVVSVKTCSEWNTTKVNKIFGANHSLSGNDESSLNLTSSSLTRDPRNKSIAIVDDNNARILILDLSNLSVYFAIVFNNSSAPVNQSSFVTYARNDSIYILDGWNRRIIKLNSSPELGDNFSLVINLTWSSVVYSGFCVDPVDGSIYLSDREHHRIIHVASGASNGIDYVGNGSAGDAKDLLNHPTSIAMDDRRRL